MPLRPIRCHSAGSARWARASLAAAKRTGSVLAWLVLGATILPAQTPAAGLATPRLVLVLSRHGLRAPIASEIRGNRYNPQPWPAWSTPPGRITPHGAQALRLLGGYFRQHYPHLLSRGACAGGAITAEADTSPRTVASARDFLSGLAPGCSIPIGVRRPRPASGPDTRLLLAATLGRLGGDPARWVEAERQPLEELEHVLRGCAGEPNCDLSKASIFSAPSRVVPSGGGLVTIESPVSVGADFAEHFLLEYAEGFPMRNVGWGRVNRALLRHLMAMNTRFHDYSQRGPLFAKASASGLALAIAATLRQAASGKAVEGAIGPPRQRFVLLDHHDAELARLGGLLRLRWLLPGEAIDATPPGSSLVFELRQDARGRFSVTVSFVSQSLEQIRYLTPLTAASGPAVSPIFVPGCSRAAPGFPCPLEEFSRTVAAASGSRPADR